jgi:hypothetical protein
MLGGEIREVRDTMGVRIEVTIASVRRVRESSSVGGFDGGRAMRSVCIGGFDDGRAMHSECTLRVCTCLRRRKFVDPVERISKRPSVVGAFKRDLISKYPSVFGTFKRGGCVVVPCEAILL